MMRRLFNLAALLSLILCLACIFMWVRSGYVADSVGKWRGFGAMAHSEMGGLHLAVGHLESTYDDGPPAVYESSLPLFLGDSGGVWYWQWNWPAVAAEEGVVHLALPWWVPTATALMLPSFWLWNRRKEKRQHGRHGFAVEAKA